MAPRHSSAPPLRAVTFDFWNTLIQADDRGIRDRRLTAWLGLLAGEGFEPGDDAVGAAMRHARERFDESWHDNRIYGAGDAVTDALAHLGLTVSSALRDELVASITDPDPAHDPEPTPGVAEALEALQGAGVRIGIICDVGLAPSSTLRRFLTDRGLIGAFDHWSFSDEVGCFKPDPAIFAHAFAGLGDVDPAAAAHIGDLRRTDIAGAQGVGAFAIRYTGVYDDPGSADLGTDRVEGDAVLADWGELPAVLGLA